MRSTPTISSTNPVWATLSGNPLKLPTVKAGAACPINATVAGAVPAFPLAAGTSPVYVQGTGPRLTLPFTPAESFPDATSNWGGIKAIWAIAPSYTGPILLRGARLDGVGAVRFNGGLGQLRGNNEGTEPIQNDLRLHGGSAGPGNWSLWTTFFRLQSAGCYGLQLDGENFTQILIFQATSQ